MLMSQIVFKKRLAKGLTNITEQDIRNIQSFYDKGNSLRECQKVFGIGRPTLIKYLKTRSRTKLHEDQKRQKNIHGVVSWRQRTKQKLVDYKGGKCKFCGYDKYIGNLTFHHRDPMQKDFTISGQTMAFDRLKSEVDKCELVCHNCHGEIHAGLQAI